MHVMIVNFFAVSFSLAESEGFNWLAGAFASFDLFHNGVTSFRVLNMWRTLSNNESIEKMAWKKSDSVYVVRAYDYGFCR